MENDAVTAYWLAHYVGEHGLCVLCGNRGVVDTRPTAISPRGAPVGTLTYCLCPNGQQLRTARTHLPTSTTPT